MNFSHYERIRARWLAFKGQIAYFLSLGVITVATLLSVLGYLIRLKSRPRQQVEYLVYGRGPTAVVAASILAQTGYPVTLMAPHRPVVTTYLTPGGRVEVPLSWTYYDQTYSFQPFTEEDKINLETLTGCQRAQIDQAIAILTSNGLTGQPMFEDYSLAEVTILHHVLKSYQWNSASQQVELICRDGTKLTTRHLILCDEIPLEEANGSTHPVCILRGLMARPKEEGRLEVSLQPYVEWRAPDEWSILPEFTAAGLVPYDSWSHGPLWMGLSPLRPNPRTWVLSCLSLQKSWDPLRDGFILAILSADLLLRP